MLPINTITLLRSHFTALSEINGQHLRDSFVIDADYIHYADLCRYYRQTGCRV